MDQFGLKESHLSPKEMGVIKIACKIPSKIPSEKQAKIVVDIDKKLKSEGFYILSTKVVVLAWLDFSIISDIIRNKRMNIE